MDNKQRTQLIQEAVRDADLHPADIPSIDLYLDQITCLMNERVKEGAERFHDRVLTKTMINNYSKDGLISPVKGKKYSKEQFLQMLLVYELKNTLSIGEIKRVLQNVYALPEANGEFLEGIYSRYLAIKEKERREMPHAVDEFLKNCDLDSRSDADFFTLLLGLSSMSAYLKTVVQALLEARYPDLEAEKEREEQDKKEEIKRQKDEKKAAKAAKAAKKEKNDNAEKGGEAAQA